MDFDSLPDDSAKAAPSGAPQTLPNFDSLVGDEETHGTIGQQALAGLEGAARGLTLGASDLIEPNISSTTAQDIAARKEANPATAFTGNVLGGAGLVGLTGGLAAPAEGALVAKGVGGLAAKALAYGAEGAVFGAGNTVSDYALGDPNLNASKVFANVGLGALFGAGIGASIHGVKGLIGGSVADVADKANAAAETSDALANTNTGGGEPPSSGGGDANVDTPSGFFKTIGTPKAEAPAIRKALTDLNIDIGQNSVLEAGMTSANRTVQHMTSALIEGAPSVQGAMVQNDAQAVWKGVNSALDDVLDTGDKFGGGAMSQAELGTAFQKSLTSKIEQEIAPINDMYNSLKAQNVHIDVSENAAAKVARKIADLQDVRIDPNSPAASLAKRISGALDNLDSVDDLKFLNSSIRKSLSPTASSGEKHMAGVLSDMLTDLEESSIKAAAKDPSLPVGMRKEMLAHIDAADAAKEAYAPVKQKIVTLLEQLGKKNVAGAQTAIDHVNGLDVEDIVSKLAKGKSEFGDFLQKNFPQESAILSQYEKQGLRQAASKTGEFSPKTFFKLFNELPVEKQNRLFGADEIDKIRSAETLINKGLPKNYNGSNTDNIRVLRGYFENGPIGVAKANARDWGMGALIKALGASPESGINPYEAGAELADKFNKMSAVQSMANQADEKIATNAKSIFSPKDAARGAATAGASLIGDHGYDKVVKNIKNLADNPAGIMDHLVHHVGDLNQSLPNVTQGIHNTSIAALSYLNSKMPRAANSFPLAVNYRPSDAEKSKFMRYYNAVNNPIGVLDQVKHGTLTNEALDALQHVHPQLLQQMQQQVVGEVKKLDHAKISYAVKMSVAKFLGTPLDSSMTPQVIQSNQASLNAPQQGDSSAAPTGRKGSMKALNLAQPVKTQTQDDESDTD